LLGFFIDRGYLEIAKVQTGLVTNLIQVIEDLNASFLGTMNNNPCFPFQFVEINLDGKRVVNGKVVAQTYGMRTNFVAKTKSNRPIQASVMRHGMGKTRCVRVAKNMPRFMRNVWVLHVFLIKIILHLLIMKSLILRNSAFICGTCSWQEFRA
jgi:hypothetical protein